jgi:hypothetical protein
LQIRTFVVIIILARNGRGGDLASIFASGKSEFQKGNQKRLGKWKVTFSDEAIELLLVLLELNVDSLSRTFQENFSPKVVGFAGRIPNEFEMKLAKENQLSMEIKRQLESLHLARARR